MLGPLPPETSASVRRLTAAVARVPSVSLARNRRTELRRSARLGCRVRRVDDWSLVGDRTLDLSPRGMLLLSDEQIDPGTDLVVSFQATELPIWFDTMATLVRVVEGRRPGDAGRALGIHFETLPSVSRLILRGFLRKLPSPSPQREPPTGLAGQDPDYARLIRDIWEGRA